MNTPLRYFRAFIALAILIGLSACARDTVDQTGVYSLDHARVAWRTGEPAQTVALPHDWNDVNPSFEGTATYWLEVPNGAIQAAKAQRDMLGLFIGRSSMNANVFVGNSLVSAAHAQGARQWNSPLLIRIPAEVIEAEQGRVRIDVYGLYLFRGGLSQVRVGPVEALEREFSLLEFLRVDASQIASAVALLAGIYVLVFWWGAREQASFGWFGAACLVWAFRHTNFFWEEPPLSFEVYSRLVLWGNYLAYTLFLLFALSFTNFRRRWLEILILVYGLLPLPLMLLLGRSMVLYAPAYGVPGVVLALAISGGIIWQWRRTREVEYVVVGGVVGLYLAFLIRDYTIMSNGQYDGVYISHHMMAFLSLAVSWLMVRRQIQSSRAIEGLQEHLKVRLSESQAAIELSHMQQRELELAAARRMALASERSRMMRDMHDGVGSQLVAGLHALRAHNVSSESAVTLIDQILDDLRLAIDALEPSSAELLAPLGNFRYRLMPRLREAGIAVQWEVDDGVETLRFDPAVVLQVLRLVQEACANAIKHSQASEIVFRLSILNVNSVRILIQDNGLGFDQEQVQLGRGISNMRSRAAEIGSELKLSSSAGLTIISFDVPVDRHI
jgi:signal transduction histidine kinase